MSTTTSNRRLLVIGSQCEALGEGYRLKFLPPAAEELYKVLVDPDFGRCRPVQPDRGLLIDPTVAAVKTAIREAFQLASDDGSTLLLVFIGHGTYVGNDYFFLPLDAASAPDPDTGIHVVQQIDYAYRAHPSIDGLVLLVDTCHSGLAAERAAAQWVGEYRRGEEAARKLRFEILTASAPDREAWDGCFTHTVTHCLRQGLDDVPTGELRCGSSGDTIPNSEELSMVSPELNEGAMTDLVIPRCFLASIGDCCGQPAPEDDGRCVATAPGWRGRRQRQRI
jgi:hypothetical protein